MSDVPRSEYPRPQFVRDGWLCLNGEWEFEIDYADTGRERGLCERPLELCIAVPFCPESAMSGIEHKDFMNAVWYRRTIEIPDEWQGRDVLLHFQAVDYDATIWVNGVEVGKHRGGFSPFTCELRGVAGAGETATIVVRARDLRETFSSWDTGPGKPCGKQSNHQYANAGCHYDRTTGIWQTVWMEPVPATRLGRPRITPDVAGSRFIVEQPITNSRKSTRLAVTLKMGDEIVARTECATDSDFTPCVDLVIADEQRKLWCPKDPFLYDLAIELLDSNGNVIDAVRSYAGLRSVTVDGKAVLLNGEPVFQRLVLDQGYYPEGIMTAPSDEALWRDIELAQAVGFNGARLHQKVFEERFLYHADRLGYLVWGEFGDWGIDRTNTKATYITQWLEVLARDYSHPSIVGWCPLNETAQTIGDAISGLDDLTRGLLLATKAMDRTRPVLDASGYSHRVPETDIYDSHDYNQDPESFAKTHAGAQRGEPFVNAGNDGQGNRVEWSAGYRDQPYFVSEFGGAWWNPEAAAEEYSWGYGGKPRNVEEFYERFEKLCAVLLGNPGMFAYCYTQLTDVYQEQNGIYHFDRRPKFDAERLRAAQSRKAAIERS
jgi:beta-galactosidase/beta-glucuronidase